MHKSTVILSILVILLSASTATATWLLVNQQEAQQPAPLAGGAHIGIGIDASGDETADKLFSAASALLYDPKTDNIMFQENGFERRPIASITKLMTAMVAMDYGIDWNTEVTIQPQEYVQGGRLLLHPGESVTMRDAFNASIVGSANNATLAYVRTLGIPQDEFIEEMNRKAISMQLEQTQFVDVTGLSPKNVSTAYEVARMAHAAFSQYPDIARAASQKEYIITVPQTGREHTITNTNPLVSKEGLAVTGSKTGFLYEAGYCLVMEGAEQHTGRVSVILGSPSEYDHVIESKRLLEMKV